MKRLLLCITASALLGMSAPAQEPAKEPAAAAAPAPGAEFLAKFDLDKNGSVTFEEFQKVKSGFTKLDADGNGAITQADLAKVMEQRRARMQKMMRRQMKHRMQQARRGRGMGPPAFGQMGGGRAAGFGPMWGQQRGFGAQMGPAGRGGPGAGVCPWCQQPCEQMGQGQGQGPRGPMGPGRGMGWGSGAPENAPPAPPPSPPQR
jgi:EF hand